MAKNAFRNVRSTVEAWYANIFGTGPMDIPNEGEDTVYQYVYSLWEESNKWRQKSFNRMNYQNPLTFWSDARKLEQGLHWEVWGKRAQNESEEAFKHEIVDDDISNQIRVRKSNLAANWHDISVLPNILGITEYFDQEREQTGWGDQMLMFMARGLTEGCALLHTILDKSEYPDGVAREIIIGNESIFPTPFATGLDRIEGTWHLIIGQLMTEQQIFSTWPDADRMEFVNANQEIARYLTLNMDAKGVEEISGHTKMIPVFTIWMDDPKIVRDRKDPEEPSIENMALKEGVSISVVPEQNHVEHIDSHLAFIEQLQSEQPETEEDATIAQSLMELMIIHMQEHYKQISVKRAKGLSAGAHEKYPFGRKIVVASGNVLEDVPNPHEKPWRQLFHMWYNERVPGSFWGRGVPEILWNTNKTEDTMLSRTADIGISIGIPKIYFNEADRENVELNGLDNNPLKPGFVTTPPTIRQGSAPKENMEIYNAMKANAAHTQGVTDVSYGEAPGATSSGKLVELLLAQNRVVVTGEANQRLDDTIAAVVRTRLHFYRKYYTEPRWYFINGFPVAENLSKLLTTYTYTDPKTQQPVTKEVPVFQVTVRPNSNFPSRFEYELAFLLQLAQTPSPDGTPYVSREAIIDCLSERYPKLGRDGTYYKMSEATAIGMKVMAEEQARKEAEAKTLRTVAGKFIAQGIREITGGDGAVMTRPSPPGAETVENVTQTQPTYEGGPANGEGQ